jgi:hypothetical protein
VRDQSSGGGNGYEKCSNGSKSAYGTSVGLWHWLGYPAKDSHFREKTLVQSAGLCWVSQNEGLVLYLEATEAGIEAIVSMDLG